MNQRHGWLRDASLTDHILLTKNLTEWQTREREARRQGREDGGLLAVPLREGVQGIVASLNQQASESCRRIHRRKAQTPFANAKPPFNKNPYIRSLGISFSDILITPPVFLRPLLRIADIRILATSSFPILNPLDATFHVQ